MNTPTFDATAYDRLPATVAREQALVRHIHAKLAEVGQFATRERRLYFHRGRRALPVSLLPGSDFARLVARVVGVSVR